jgi:hypothetical protein
MEESEAAIPLASRQGGRCRGRSGAGCRRGRGWGLALIGVGVVAVVYHGWVDLRGGDRRGRRRRAGGSARRERVRRGREWRIGFHARMVYLF